MDKTTHVGWLAMAGHANGTEMDAAMGKAEKKRRCKMDGNTAMCLCGIFFIITLTNMLQK